MAFLLKMINTLVVLVALLAMPAYGDIYRCVGADGSASFQNQPCITVDVNQAVQDGAQAAQDKTFLWQVDGPRGRLYLLGSIHFGVASMYPLSPEIEKAYADSDVLVVEADILNANAQQTAALVSANGVYADGSTLQQHLAASTWQALEDASAGMGINIEVFKNQKPWLVSLSLSMAALQKLGLEEGLGVDVHFLRRASTEAKRIVELEGMQFQLELFNKLSAAEQEAMLVEALAELEEGQAFFDATLAAWQAGDAAAMAEIFEEGLGESAAGDRLYELVMTERNHRMVEKLSGMLKIPGTYFVVVGAGHMVGDEGLVQLMTSRGYTVRQH